MAMRPKSPGQKGDMATDAMLHCFCQLEDAVRYWHDIFPEQGGILSHSCKILMYKGRTGKNNCDISRPDPMSYRKIPRHESRHSRRRIWQASV